MIIEMDSVTHNETKWLFKQYGHSVPTWLRKRFVTNQRRSKRINDELREAQLDRAYCGKCSHEDDWASKLHLLWHEINEVEKCL